MVGLDKLANLAEVFGFLAVIGGLVFAIVQIRQARSDRREAASMTILTTYMQTPGSMEAIRCVMALKPGWVKDAKIREDQDLKDAIDQLQVLLEITGLMVYRRAVDLDDVEAMQGDMIRAVWPKLRPWAERLRAQHGREGPFEWAEWLHDRLIENQPRQRRGAFAEYASWRP